MADEMTQGTPQPEAPAKPSVAQTVLEQYFQSVEEPFRETCEGFKKEAKGVNTAAVVFFIFSLIPLFPYVASRLAWRYFSSTIVSLWALHFHIGSFWFWWVALFIASLAVLSLAIKMSGVSAEEKKKWLSPPQMRFAYCYAVVDEIRKYRTNQRGQHIDTALEYLGDASNSLLPRSGVFYQHQYWRREALVSQQQAVGGGDPFDSPPRWFRLRPESELVLKAFSEFEPKLKDRLKDRKDLPEIEAVMTYLASYQYLEIPELSDSKSGPRFEEGMQSLLVFAQRVTALASYRSEELKPTQKQKLSLKVAAFVSAVTAPFWHDNVFVAFVAWWLFLALLFCGGVFGLLRLFQVKMDSAIITTLVAGPILGAVTAVTIPRVGRKKNGN
jgi:hypothetical protein